MCELTYIFVFACFCVCMYRFYRRYCELRAKIKGNLWGVIHPSSSTAIASPPMRTASLKEKPLSRYCKLIKPIFWFLL